MLPLSAAQHKIHLLCIFEHWSLPTHISRWRAAKHEREINMHQTPVLSDQNVSVMSIFNCKHVAYNRVRCKGLDESQPCPLKCFGSFSSECLYEILVKVWVFSPDLVSRLAFWNGLNDAANHVLVCFLVLTDCCDYLIWNESQGKARLVEDIFDHVNQLQS